MFCPNCGTQNDSAATPCKKCGFKLSSVSAPKFKGTMMLNSEQTVQDLIDEHRRKQAQGAPIERKSSQPAPKRSPGSSAPPGSATGLKGPVLQPPRAAAPSRGRMGGTMMGVAPQAGGVVPPASGFPRPADVAPTPPPPAHAPVPPREPVRGATGAHAEAQAARASAAAASASVSPADALAGTVAVPVIAGPETEAGLDTAAKIATSTVVQPARLPDVPSSKSPVAPAAAEDDDSGAALPASEQRAAETKPPRARAIAATAAMPQQAELAARNDVSGSDPARIRPLDVVLVVCTLGLYGIVLWLRQRKPT